MPRAYFIDTSIIGTGTDADAYRPALADVTGLSGWAATYETPGDDAAVVLVDAPDLAPVNALASTTFLADVTALQSDIGADMVTDIIRTYSGAATAEWHDTHVGDWQREDKMTDQEYALLVTMYPAWVAAHAYAVGDLCSYNATLYEVVQAHTSQGDWTPPVVPALFVRRSPAGVIPLWVQPTGAHDAYALGALVIFEGQVYESLIAANVWSPTVYPAGWRLR